jgi:hypothetical protein
MQSQASNLDETTDQANSILRSIDFDMRIESGIDEYW